MTDWILYNAELARVFDLEFIETVDSNKKSEKLILILVSSGGDPDAAYKIGRYLQDTYESFEILLPSLCKSAGTLLAIAGEKLIFTPYGDLGPLDIQVPKEDKLGVHESGLNISEAMYNLEFRAKETFHSLIEEILYKSNGIVSIRTAMSAASDLVSSIYSPIFSQFDPEELGSRLRAMRIGEEYAKRLNAKWRNLKPRSIDYLLFSYPSHSSVIDFNEAHRMFNNVRLAKEDEIEVVKKIGKAAWFPLPQEEQGFRFLQQTEVSTNGQHAIKKTC